MGCLSWVDGCRADPPRRFRAQVLRAHGTATEGRLWRSRPTLGFGVDPWHHSPITRGRVNLARPGRGGYRGQVTSGENAIGPDDSMSVQIQPTAVPRTTGPRVQRATLL
jgi:hypothetical protein